MIRYTADLDGIEPVQLEGFFVGWLNPPSPETHLRILHGSQAVMLAIDDERGQVAGFITALTDGVLSAYIPLLEVLPEYQGEKIGTTLVQLMLDHLSALYMVDIMCDDELQSFYARFGMQSSAGMMLRRYDRQQGSEPIEGT
jgi:ribosomal protein S18 acetylase RimI-like enzyme